MRWSSFAFISFLTIVLAGGWACDHKLPPGSPGGGGAAIGAFVTVGFGGGDVFSPAAVTITHGTAIVWYYEGGYHTVSVDNGAGTGTCADYFATSPATSDGTPGQAVTETFTTAGLYYFHCEIHASCGTDPCSTSTCTGMSGTVSVQ